MFKDKQFRVRPLSEVLDDLEDARKTYRRVERIFLADGDALVLKQSDLITILTRIRELFPECERVGIYGSPQDVLRKSTDELAELAGNGVHIIYIGAESGSDRVLKAVKKGATAAEITEAIIKIEKSGIAASVTFISGLSGKIGWEDHAIESAKVISKAEPSYVGLLTLMTEATAPLTEDIREGRFELLSPEGVVEETLLMVENIDVTKECVFRSNHASNYLSLKGTLPQDKNQMIALLKSAIGREDVLKEEWMRML
jgi:radical SAM superfamily enzyme YgiQ (UPF0313 family)